MPILKTKNFKENTVNLLDNNPRTTDNIKEKYKIKSGDLLIVLGGATGQVAFWYGEDVWLNQHIMKIVCNDMVTTKYVGYYLRTKVFSEYVSNLTKRTTIPHVSVESVLDFKIALPPMEKQQELQEAFDEVMHKHKLIARYKAKADEAIKKYIPGADQQEEEEAGPSTNEHVQPVVQEPSSSSTTSVASKSSVKELKEQCKSLGIKGYSTKKKEELLKMIQEHQAK